MSRKVREEIFLLFWVAGSFLYYAEASSQCDPHYFTCSNGSCVFYTKVCDGNDDCGDNSEEHFCNPKNCQPDSLLCLNWRCIYKGYFCDGPNHCGDNSDERYCNIHYTDPCPPGWYRCPNGKRCIPFLWMCNGQQECQGISEEDYCDENPVLPLIYTAGASKSQISTDSPNITAFQSPEHFDPKAFLKSWLLRRGKSFFRPDRWGSQAHRVAVALHLADESTFSPGNSTGEEIRTELTLQLHRIGKDKKMSSQELALYIHGLLVSCMDPRDFYGDDLVKELRRRVEASGNFTNPFLILVLCNAGDTMTMKDVDRVTVAYNSQYRPLWTDYKALASMALSCISSHSDVSVEERILKDMLGKLKKRQFENGTVDNFRTTALVSQALLIHNSYKTDFDLDSALKGLMEGLNASNSLLDSYYALPVLNRKSLLNVTSAHCRKDPDSRVEELVDVKRETIIIFFSVLVGEEINGSRTWRLRMLPKSTIYDAIETLANIDSRQKFEYNVVEGKPYVRSLNDQEDDPEMGMFWFLYLKALASDKEPMIVEASPVDIEVQANQEIILWYKRAPWSRQNLIEKSEKPI